jgi:nucleoside phosphorylase
MGERNGEFSLGDILVSEQIIDFEMEKSRASKEDIEHRWQHMASDNDLLGRLKASSRVSASVWSGLPDRPEGTGLPTIHFGDVLSGSEVVDSPKRKGSLKTQRPLAKGLEMEAAGVALVMTELAMPGRFLMAKAFSDWADGKKDDQWRHYCCESAAAYCAHLVIDVLPAYLQSKEDEVSVDRVLAAQLKRATERRLWPGYGNFRIGSSIGARIAKAAAEEINRLGALEHALGETLEQGGSANSDGVYRASIGTGDQFLLRAEPLFSRAAHVIATSLDAVSTFWMNPKKKQHARNYIKLQGKKSTGRTSASRLFVFSSPASAHRYARRLDFRAPYCTGTYLCSLDSYKKLLEQWAPEHLEKYSRRDFAFLTYGAGERLARLFADLDEDTLSVRRSMSVYDGGEVDWEKVQVDFHGYALLKPGEVNAASLVMRWDREIWRDATTWAGRLKQLFVLPKADVRHLIGLELHLDEATLQPLRHELVS